MGYLRRIDEPGDWHHVYNRGLARRQIFEEEHDYHFFLGLLEQAVDRGEIEVHAYSLMGNHFHLMVRSPSAGLSVAMQRIKSRYTKWFNWHRERDGPLLRGRFMSKWIETDEYHEELLHYIDHNAVDAGLADRPADYRWGSAAKFASRRPPAWLSTDWIKRREGYLARLGQPGSGEYRLPTLRVELWMQKCEELADGKEAPHRRTAWVMARELVGESRSLIEWPVNQPGRPRSGWDLLLVGLGRDVAAVTYRDIAEALGCSTSGAHRLHAKHLAALSEDPLYAQRWTQANQRLAEKMVSDTAVPTDGSEARA